MNEKEEGRQSSQWDRHLDTPAEANTQKHINFLDTDEGNGDDKSDHRKDKATRERQKQWREGLEEGKRTNRENS